MHSRLAGQTDEYAVESPPSPWWLTAKRLFDPPWPAIDRVDEIAIVALVALVATYAVIPGVAQELSPNRGIGRRAVPPIELFQVAGIAHNHAVDLGAGCYWAPWLWH